MSDTPSPRPPLMNLPRNDSGFDGLEAVGREVEVHQSWLARFFNVKPATREMCFRVSRRRARRELIKLLKEWRKYGIRDLQVDKTRSVVFARVGDRNFLDIKPLTFAIEISMVVEHPSLRAVARGKGKKDTFAIARFIQERGAVSSFHKVYESLETVLDSRGLILRDKNKCRMMIKTLNSPATQTVISTAVAMEMERRKRGKQGAKQAKGKDS